MSYIIKKNDPLINLKLTDTGRRNLSAGELNFSSFTLGDSEMDYTNNTPKKLNILRPTDNNHDILYPIPYNGTTYKIPITTITSFPNIAHSSAKSRGFFSGDTYNLIEPSLSTLYNLSGFITGGTNNLQLVYTKTTGSSTFVNYGVGTGYTTSLVNTGYTSNIKTGDYVLLKLIQNDYYTGHTTSMTPYVGTDPIQYLWYNITSVNGGQTLSALGLVNNQNITLTLDRELPTFGKRCRVKAYIYPGKNTISDFYDKESPIAYWSNGSLSFTPIPGQTDIVDVPVWNMNIVNIKDIMGLDDTVYKSRTESVGHDYMGTAIDYGYLTNIYTNVNDRVIITGITATVVVTGYTQTSNKIGIIHYTNNTIENFYGEGFYSNTLTLNIPYLMWHKEQFGGAGLGNTIGYTFVCGSTLKYIDGKVPYYDLVDQETKPTIVGKVLVDQKVIIIEDAELLSAMSFKANRNWTLPTPQISLVDVGHCTGANVGGSLGVNESIHISYLFTNDKNVTGIHCENYQTIDNNTTKPKDILFQFTKDPLDPTYSEFSFIRDYGSENGLGYSIDTVYLLWQKTALNRPPDPVDWKKFNISRYVNTTGCLSYVAEASDNFYLQNDTNILSVSTTYPLSTTKQPLGDVLVFTGASTNPGRLLKAATSAANVGVNGDYYMYPLSVTGSTSNTPIFKFKPAILTNGNWVQFNYLAGETNSSQTRKQQVVMPSSLSGYNYTNGIYLNGSNVCLTLDYQPNNNVVYLFYNGALVSSNNYGVYTTGTTANRRVQLTFTPTTGSDLVLYYLDNSGTGTNPNLNQMTANNIHSLNVYIDKDIIDQSENNYYDLNDVVTLPAINTTGVTFGDEVFFFGNVDTDIKATIYKTLLTFNVLPNTFIVSDNPTFDINGDNVAFTEIGVYDGAGNLVAIGKFSEPITRKYLSDLVVIQGTIDF